MIKYSILSDNSEETIEQKILTTEMKTRSTEKFDANRSENTENKRLVKCPKCHKVLREPNAPVSVYRCGGCGAVLRAKLRTTSGETTTTESNSNISMDLSEKDSFNESLTISVSKSSILSDNSEETIEQKILTTEMKTRSTEKFNANQSEKTEFIRLVKCPKCHKVLPEPNAPKYRCGGCGVLLRAKLRTTSGETTKTESNPNIFMDLSEKDFFSEPLTVSASKSSILSDTSEETIEQNYLTTEIQMRSTEKLEANRSEKTEILSHENINLNSNSNLTENSSKEEHVDSITNKEEPDTDPFGGSSHEKPLIGRQSISSLKRIEIEDWIHTLPVGIPCDYDARDLSILPSEKEKSISVISINDKGGLTGHMVDKVTIFGRSAETMEVSNFLLSEREKSFSVISIVGKGGLGKTTIAQLVYKDLRASRCFDLFGWVCVSEGFDVRRLIKVTIESISKINYGVSELSLLQVELAEIVKEKTILLVLDDVCNENQSLWELFQEPFIEAKMVRILVTTRNEKVAEVMQTTCYRPTNLPEYLCWQLFQHHALSSTSETLPTHLVDMGREIMRKCDGLPLAVKIIASLLRHETNEKVWRGILESDLWESNPTNSIFPALQISYDHLPAHLKLCFLVCSMYPKDYLLEKMNLIDLWISHGYIESRGKRRTTEIGVEYYEELKERSFIDGFSNCIPEWWHMQPMYALDESSGQFFEFCKLHDIIHDLARHNSKKEHYSMEINQPLDIQKENFLPEVHHLYAGGFVGYVKQILQRNDQNLKDLRTLSLDVRGCSGDLEHQYCINNTEAVDLNSKLSKDYEECSGEVAIWPISNIIKFEGLMVLELKGYNLRKIPDCIYKLKHLAYLSITSSCLKVLPLSIGLLYNLQTLFLDCFLLEYLPESIGNLANLQFLYIQSGRVKKLPKSLCSLNNLLRLVIRSDDLEEVPLDIKNLCNLHTLTIRSNQIQALPNTIGCLTNLEELNLLSLGGSYDDLPVGKLDYVPHGYVNFPAIKIMTAWMGVRTINWLKDMKDLEGKLSIGGLKHMSNLKGAQHANLRNKCKLETLDLCWDPGYYMSPYDAKSELRLSLIPEACKGELVCADVVSFSLLECLQPHPNLKKLLVRWYPSPMVPYWMRDPSSFRSIQEVLLECCANIQSLPFKNFHS